MHEAHTMATQQEMLYVLLLALAINQVPRIREKGEQHACSSQGHVRAQRPPPQYKQPTPERQYQSVSKREEF